MLFQFTGKPQHLARLLKLFKGLSPRLRTHRSRYGWTVLIATVLYAFGCGLILPRVNPAALDLAWYFAIWGGLFIAWGWALSSLYQRYPAKQGIDGFGRFFLTLLLLIVAIGGLVAASEPGMGDRLGTLTHKQAWIVWGVGNVGAFLFSRWIVWLRMADQMVQDYELDFLHNLLMPLLRDLPPDASCDFACNPFTPMWSQSFSSEKHGNRRLDMRDDVLLDFKAKLADGSVLALQTFHQRVDKYKTNARNKTKFKGTKHRVEMVCRFQHPALARLEEAGLRQLGELCQRLNGQRRGYAINVLRDVSAGKITLTAKARFADLKELDTPHMPDVNEVLGALRLFSSFAVHAQKPA
jgi:hypothetical protein